MQKVLLVLGLGLLVQVANAQSGTELLKSTGFDDGWESEWHSHMAEEFVDNTPKMALIKRPKQIPEIWVGPDHTATPHYIGIAQDLPTLENGKSYQVTIEARLRGGLGKIRYSVRSSGKNNVHHGFAANLPINETWQRFETKFTASRIKTIEVPHIFISFAGIYGPVSVRHVSVKEIEGTFDRYETEIIKIPKTPTAASPAAIAGAFASDPVAAKATYTTGPQAVSGLITSISKSGGALTCGIDFGKMRVVVNPKTIDPQVLSGLATAVKKARATLTIAGKTQQWQNLTPELRLDKQRKWFPTFSGTVMVTGFKGGTVECGRSMDVTCWIPPID